MIAHTDTRNSQAMITKKYPSLFFSALSKLERPGTRIVASRSLSDIAVISETRKIQHYLLCIRIGTNAAATTIPRFSFSLFVRDATMNDLRFLDLLHDTNNYTLLNGSKEERCEIAYYKTFKYVITFQDITDRSRFILHLQP